jgi:hypothetical protein
MYSHGHWDRYCAVSSKIQDGLGALYLPDSVYMDSLHHLQSSAYIWTINQEAH